MTWAAAVLAAAVLLAGGRSSSRIRVRRAAVGHSQMPDASDDPLAVASSLDVFAACLHSGMAVARAAKATAPSAPEALARVLHRAADLLTLGALPVTAWSNSEPQPDDDVEAFCRLARRSAESGAALAQAVTELAERSRLDAADNARSAGERASVLIAGPLGLCYLPAFVCLGIVPVVVGLAGDVLRSGLW